jgi:pyridoxal 5'-phosphate synthase pdxT subunit
MVFIRPPKISRIGAEMSLSLLPRATDAVAVRQGTAMAATFHPELAHDPRSMIHNPVPRQVFLQLVAQSISK